MMHKDMGRWCVYEIETPGEARTALRIEWKWKNEWGNENKEKRGETCDYYYYSLVIEILCRDNYVLFLALFGWRQT